MCQSVHAQVHWGRTLRAPTRNRRRFSKPQADALEARRLLSTVQDFEGALGTAFVAQSYVALPTPTTPAQVLPGGPTGNFIRLATDPPPTHNGIAFDRSDAGTFARISISFDFRITPVSGKADGFGIALLNTGEFGPAGAVPPSELLAPF